VISIYTNKSYYFVCVPQGSVLGPKMFILVINICLKYLKMVLFADDTHLYSLDTVEIQLMVLKSGLMIIDLH